MSTAVESVPLPVHPHPKRGEPAWDLALMYPLQGDWSVEDYLRLDTGMLVEYNDGFIRVLPMPNMLHQWIVQFLFRVLDDYVKSRGLGEVFLAPLPIELPRQRYREPDVTFVRPERIERMKGQPRGADLVIEVVSEGRENRQRDYVEKRAEYAAAGIAEYWIVDPEERKLTVLVLDGDRYREGGVFHAGDTAASVALPGLTVPVCDVFAKCGESG
jgi:Uma2 family endonuclease